MLAQPLISRTDGKPLFWHRPIDCAGSKKRVADSSRILAGVRMSTCHRRSPIKKTGLSSCDRDSRVFSIAGRVISSLSAVTSAPFDSFAELSRSGQAPVAYHRRKLTDLRLGLGCGCGAGSSDSARVMAAVRSDCGCDARQIPRPAGENAGLRDDSP
jgi:hypothetical protein